MDFCFLLYIMEQEGSQLVQLKVLRNTLKQQQCLFPEITNQFLKIILRFCLDQFDVGAVFLSTSFTHQPCNCAEGGVRLLVDESVGCKHLVLLDCAVMVASLVSEPLVNEYMLHSAQLCCWRVQLG